MGFFSCKQPEPPKPRYKIMVDGWKNYTVRPVSGNMGKYYELDFLYMRDKAWFKDRTFTSVENAEKGIRDYEHKLLMEQKTVAKEIF